MSVSALTRLRMAELVAVAKREARERENVLETVTRLLIETAHAECGGTERHGSQRDAAKLLGVTQAYFNWHLQKYGLRKRDRIRKKVEGVA